MSFYMHTTILWVILCIEESKEPPVSTIDLMAS
uniref:Uncharacterized protein n=1 Tax=Moniliophthora roreri TaxID=221103 RepID=A0A0W0FYI8_MONRR